MSTSPTILPTFTNGQSGSASQIMSAFDSLFNLGKSSLENLTNIRIETLLAFQRRVSYLNSKQQSATKLINQNSLVNFSVTDFSNIDQSETTATVRIDTNAVSSAEQDIEVEAVIKSIQFTSNIGNVEIINSSSSIYRVYNTDSKTPTGTFFITLREKINLSVLVFDMPSISSNPIINILVSDAGITYTPCISYSLNGYRLIVYLAPAEIQFIKLVITPSHPDNLGGSLFTFGITDFVGNSAQYRLLSEFVTRPINFIPNSVNCQLSAVDSPGILYFLAFNNDNYTEVNVNIPIPIPGVSVVNHTAVSLDSSGLLATGTSSTVYTQTLEVIDQTTNVSLPILHGIVPANPLLANLIGNYISLVGTQLYYIPYISGDSSKTFTINYIEGPASMSAQLKVQISTDDKNSSPIFNGAVLLSA